MLFINKIREEELNIKVLNYLSLIYLFSLMTSYEVGSILIYIILVIFLFNENLKKHLINSINNKFVQACILYFSISVVWMLGTEDLSYAYAQIKINKVFLYSILFVAILRKEYINKFIYIFLFTLFINIFWSYLIFFNLASSPFLTTDNLPLLVKTDHSFFILIGIAYSLFRIINYNEKLLYKIIFITLIVLETINIFISNNKTIMILYLIIILFTLVYIFRKRVVSILIFF
jgi:O-antigen ligase